MAVRRLCFPERLFHVGGGDQQAAAAAPVTVLHHAVAVPLVERQPGKAGADHHLVVAGGDTTVTVDLNGAAGGSQADYTVVLQQTPAAELTDNIVVD